MELILQGIPKTLDDIIVAGSSEEEHFPVADPENKAGGFTTTVRKSLHVTSIRGRVREGDVPPQA